MYTNNCNDGIEMGIERIGMNINWDLQHQHIYSNFCYNEDMNAADISNEFTQVESKNNQLLESMMITCIPIILRME